MLQAIYRSSVTLGRGKAEMLRRIVARQATWEAIHQRNQTLAPRLIIAEWEIDSTKAQADSRLPKVE